MQLLFARHCYEECWECLNTLLRMFDSMNEECERAEVFLWAGKIQAQLKNDEKSIEYFQECLKNNSEHYGASIQLASLYLQLGQGRKAARCF